MQWYEWLILMFLRWNDFQGRSSRMEFWMPVAINFGLGILFALLGVIGTLLAWIYGILLIVPTLALGARRLHDIGQSEWLLLINLIPFIGQLGFLVLCALEGQSGTNKYGPNPKDNVSLRSTTL